MKLYDVSIQGLIESNQKEEEDKPLSDEGALGSGMTAERYENVSKLKV